MSKHDLPLTPSSKDAWDKLNAIHSAQDKDLSSHADASSSHRKPASLNVAVAGGGGGGGLHRELMKNRMEKLTGGLDPREPLPEAPRTPIGHGHRENADDLPRTPTSQDAWQKLNRIAAGQERHVHHPESMESASMEDIPWDPREPDQPRTPVHHEEVDLLSGLQGGGKSSSQSRPLLYGAGGPGAAAAAGGGAGGGSSARVHIRIELVESTKAMHDPVVEVSLLDNNKVSLHESISATGVSTGGHSHRWQPPAHFSIPVPVPLLSTATLRFHVNGKKLLGHRDCGEAFIPVAALPITHTPPVEHPYPLLLADGEVAGKVELAAYREG